MGLRCDVANLYLLVRTEDGSYIEVPWHCLKPICERCWKHLLDRRTWATRIAMQKIGISDVWVGLVTKEDLQTARNWKKRHQDKPKLVIQSMISSYYLMVESSMLATCNMIPSRDVLTRMPLEDALSTYYRWGVAYKPKRVTADWPLTLPSEYKGMFVASPEVLRQIWNRLGDRYGYSPGDIIDDQRTFERRMYDIRNEVVNPNKRDDTDIYS